MFDRPAAAAWLDAVLGHDEGHLAGAFGIGGTWVDSPNGRRYSFDCPGGRWQEFTYAWPAQRDEFLDDVAREMLTNDTLDVYVCPYPRRSRRRAKGDAVSHRLVHVDRDADTAVDLETVRALGGFVVESGTPGHEHVYVALADAAGDLHEALCRALGKRLGGADCKVSDNDVLRLPGTLNFKHDPARPVRWALRPRPVRPTVEILARQLGVRVHGPTPATLAASGVHEPVDLGTLPTAVRDALAEYTADRSVDTYRVVAACRDAGFTLGQARYLVADRDDLAGRLAERADDDVQRCWQKLDDEDRRSRQGSRRPPAPAAPAAWDDPLPLEWDLRLPKYPVHVWPPVYSAYIEALAVETQTPVDLAGSVVLGVQCGVIGGRIRVKPRAGWDEPTNEYVSVALPSGARKSPVLDDAGAPLGEVEAERQLEMAPRIAELRTERRVLDAYAEKQVSAAAKEATPALIADAQAAVMDAEKVIVPPMPRLLCGDATPEALVTLLAEQGERMVMISDEAGVFDMVSGKVHSSAGVSRLDYMLQAYSGYPIRLDRQTRGHQHLARPALTIVTTIQPWALRRLIGDQEGTERGLNARVLWSLPVDTVGYRDPEAPPVPDDVRLAYRATVRELARAMAETEETQTLDYTTAARAELVEFLRWLEPQMRRDAPLGGPKIRPWASKLSGHVVRISAALHMAVHGKSGVLHDVEDVTVQAATELGRYYLAHAVAAHTPSAGGIAEDARAVVSTLLTATDSEGRRRFDGKFRLRDLHRAMHRRFAKADDLRSVVDDLVYRGWLREDEKALELHPDAARHLNPGDSGDSGDSGSETPGHTLGGAV